MPLVGSRHPYFEALYLPELWRLDARCHPGPPGERLLLQAIAVAEEQGSPALRRRAVDDLAQR